MMVKMHGHYSNTTGAHRRPRLRTMRSSTAIRGLRFNTMSTRHVSTSQIPSEPNRKPIVLLEGWLGSQPSKLRRYREYYETNGYPTIVRIASPGMVIGSIQPIALGPRVPVKPAELDWDSTMTAHDVDLHGNNSMRSTMKLRMMHDLAWETLRAVYRHHHAELESSSSSSPSSSTSPRSSPPPPCRFIMHSFSNGGCFLYEQIQRILMTRDEQPDPHVAAALGEMELVGGVFDSCPALDLSKFDGALSYCTIEEQEEVEALYPNFRTEMLKYIDRRQEEFGQFLLHTKPVMPQLYIYSKNDPLVPYEPLDALVEGRIQNARRIRVRGDASSAAPVVQKLVLDDSPHCAHFLHHRDKYVAALDSFLANLSALGDDGPTETSRRAKL